MIDFSELQRDALGEIFNIGVGRAAASLSQIVSNEVLLSAPLVQVMAREQLGTLLSGTDFTELSAVSQSFRGAFEATATLVFPEANALEIVRLMVGPHISVAELSEFEQEAMCEVGNIILNACMSSLADLLRISFESSLPQHRFGDASAIALLDIDDHEIVLLLQVDMIISQHRIRGNILFLLSTSSMARLFACLDDYLRAQGLL